MAACCHGRPRKQERTPVDETLVSLLMIVSLGAAIGIVGGVIAFFFATVLWNNLEEIPDDPEVEGADSAS